MADKKMENVTIETKANIYFDGKVVSRTGYHTDGSRFTLGIITPGEYTFGVGPEENMQLIAGEAEVLLAGETEWKKVVAPDNFIAIADKDKFHYRSDSFSCFVQVHNRSGNVLRSIMQ